MQLSALQTSRSSPQYTNYRPFFAAVYLTNPTIKSSVHKRQALLCSCLPYKPHDQVLSTQTTGPSLQLSTLQTLQSSPQYTNDRPFFAASSLTNPTIKSSVHKRQALLCSCLPYKPYDQVLSTQTTGPSLQLSTLQTPRSSPQYTNDRPFFAAVYLTNPTIKSSVHKRQALLCSCLPYTLHIKWQDRATRGEVWNRAGQDSSGHQNENGAGG